MKKEINVLIVDDELPIRQMAARFFRAEGFQCDSAADGIEARHALSTEFYDVVLLDMCVPDINGHTLAQEILQRQPRPVVMVATGIQELKLARDLFARGVDDVAHKPCDYRLLAIKAKFLVLKRHAAGQIPDAAARCEGDQLITEFANAICEYVQEVAAERLRPVT